MGTAAYGMEPNPSLVAAAGMPAVRKGLSAHRAGATLRWPLRQYQPHRRNVRVGPCRCDQATRSIARGRGGRNRTKVGSRLEGPYDSPSTAYLDERGVDSAAIAHEVNRGLLIFAE
jgi:hypothetical protein